MDLNFCKNCGQANLPNTSDCTKCGTKLAPINDNPFAPKSAAAATSPNAQKAGNTKLYWILGIVGAVILLGGFFVVALAAGIYFYSSQNETAIENPKPKPNPNTTKEKPATDTENVSPKTTILGDLASKAKDTSLKDYIEVNYKNIGEFKMQTVSDIEVKEKKVFRSSDDESFAIYSSDEKNPLQILFSVAKFNTQSDVNVEVAAKKIKLIIDKGKIRSENKLSDGVIITYQKNKLVGILDCKNTTCADVSGIDNQKVADFYRRISSR